MGKAKWIIIAVIVIGILAVGGNLLYRMMNSGVSPDMSNMNMDSTSSAEASPATATNTVSIKNFAFSPANITVKKGTKVTWTNDDSAPHIVSETDDLKGPKSASLAKGDTYTFTFDAVGTYHYRCDIHPQMTGTVMVSK